MLGGSTSRYNLLPRYITFLHIFSINVAITDDDEGILKFSIFELLKVIEEPNCLESHFLLKFLTTNLLILILLFSESSRP